MTSPENFSFRRIGTSNYAVVVDGVVVGTVRRTRRGWDGFSAETGELLVDDYPGSRGVAAGIVARSGEAKCTRCSEPVHFDRGDGWVDRDDRIFCSINGTATQHSPEGATVPALA